MKVLPSLTDSDRLQHLRRLLPCEVRAPRRWHPLSGAPCRRHFQADRWIALLGLGAPRRVAWDRRCHSDILWNESVVKLAAPLSVEGIRELRAPVGTMKSQRRSPLARPERHHVGGGTAPHPSPAHRRVAQKAAKGELRQGLSVRFVQNESDLVVLDADEAVIPASRTEAKSRGMVVVSERWLNPPPEVGHEQRATLRPVARGGRHSLSGWCCVESRRGGVEHGHAEPEYRRALRRGPL